MANRGDSKLQLPLTWPPPQERPNDKSVPGPARFKSSELHWTGSVKLFFLQQRGQPECKQRLPVIKPVFILNTAQT